jgi:hypothetical protein
MCAVMENRRTIRRIVVLCEAHHLHDFGMDSIERLGKKNFQERFGIDLELVIERLNRKYEEAA